MSGPRLAVPPGRAGRLWLDRRLATGRRAADLLDRKLRILQSELGNLRAAAAAADLEWRQQSAEADRRLLLAALLGGERAVRLATAPGYADVQIGYAVTIGVRHPSDGSCTPPPGPDPWAGQPVEQARAAHGGRSLRRCGAPWPSRPSRSSRLRRPRLDTGCARSGTS